MTYMPPHVEPAMGPEGPMGPMGPEGPMAPDTVPSTPPTGHFPVTGLHVDAASGTLIVDYDDTPAL